MILNARNVEHEVLHVVTLVRIRALAVRGGGDAAAAPLDLSKAWVGFVQTPAQSTNGKKYDHCSRTYIHIRDD